MKKQSLIHLLAFGLFLILAIWLTWPQAILLDKAVVGGPIAEADGWQKVWNLWWTKTALLQGKNPLYTDLLFWPEGVPLGFQTFTFTNSLLVLPILMLTNPLIAYGVASILGFALSGWFTYLLAWRVSASRAGALAAGLLLEAAPAHLSRFLDGQLEHVALQWVALYLLILWQTVQSPNLCKGLLLALSIALVAYANWYHTLAIALFTLIVLCWQIYLKRSFWPLLRPWFVTFPTLALFLSPLIHGFIAGLTEAKAQALHWKGQAALFRVDLLDFVLPSVHHPLWGPNIFAYQQSLHPNSANWVVTPGYIALILIALGLILRWKATKSWGMAAGLLLIYALGPSLQINGYDTSLPLPYLILSKIPGINFGHRLSIITDVALVPLAVIGAFGTQAISEKLHGRQRLMLFSTLFAIGLFETAPPSMQIFADNTPSIYAKLRAEQGALLLVPLNPSGLHYQSEPLQAQMTHQRPIIGGYVARPPAYPLARGAPLIGQLAKLTCEMADIVPNNALIARQALAYYGFTQIILHSEQLSLKQRSCAKTIIEDFFGLKPAQIAENIIIYNIPNTEVSPFLFLGEGWSYIEYQNKRLWRWMSQEGVFYVVNPKKQTQTFALQLKMESLKDFRAANIFVDQHLVGKIEVKRHFRTYLFFVTLSPGQHEIRLTAPADLDPGSRREISLAVESISLIK